MNQGYHPLVTIIHVLGEASLTLKCSFSAVNVTWSRSCDGESTKLDGISFDHGKRF